MVIDFSQVSAKETPVLILRNLDGTAIQTLGCAYGLQAELYYNEVSTITFQLPKYVDGIEQPRYDDVIGTRIVDMNGWGQFLLIDPVIENDGIAEIKTCKAYSLEYEFTKKKLSIEESTYNFWNPVAPENTVLGIILEYMPSWSVGDVDSALVGKYRTFSVDQVNVYDFIKSTVQGAYSCIFEFDTYQRKIYVKHTDTDAVQSAMHISLDNLARKISLEEDTENIYTVLDVNGADGVDIRSVNPLGTNKIYNLDYFMNLTHFSQEMIDKWNEWKAVCENRSLEYYNLVIERMLKISEILTKQSKTDEMETIDLAVLKNAQAVKVEYLASLISKQMWLGLSSTAPNSPTGVSEPSVGGYTRVQMKHIRPEGETMMVNSADVVFPTAQGVWFDGQGNELPNYYVMYDAKTGGALMDYGPVERPEPIGLGDTMVLHAGTVMFSLSKVTDADEEYFRTMAQLQEINADIEKKEAEIAEARAEIVALQEERDALTEAMREINRACAFSNFFTDEEMLILDRYFIEESISESSFVIAPVQNYTNAGYSVELPEDELEFSGGTVTKFLSFTDRNVYTVEGGNFVSDALHLTADVVKSIVEIKQDGSVVITAYFGRGDLNNEPFPSGCISMTAYSDRYEDDTAPDEEIRGAFAYGSNVRMTITNGQCYFTQNTTEYEQYSVEWDLLNYGRECLNRLAYPSYTFSIESENFFALDEFAAFVRAVGLGRRAYISLDEEHTLTPILTGVNIEFDNLPALRLTFGDSYNSSDNAFRLVDLLEQSVSSGKRVDTSRFNYNSFIDSGASTAVKTFMDSALDVSKNAVLSGNNMEISWDASGLHCRRAADGGGYAPEEIAIINNSIIFTDDNWATARMAIGHFVDSNVGDTWGIVAPNLVGTLIAGNNLVIESQKQDGGVSVFRVDGDGAVLHNARFDIEDGNRHIVLDPQLGFAIGSYPLINRKNGIEYIDIGSEVNPGNAKFWVDTDGNVIFRGTLDGCDGSFSGAVSWRKVISDGGDTINAEISFANGSTGDRETDLIAMQSDAGILLKANEAIGISARSGVWFQNIKGEQIHLQNPLYNPESSTTAGKFVSLKEYILQVVNGQA